MSHWGTKIEEYQQMVNIVHNLPGIRKSMLASMLGVKPSTINRRLPALEEVGILLSEDVSGRLYVFPTEKSIPHTRGGEPEPPAQSLAFNLYSPHTWG